LPKAAEAFKCYKNVFYEKENIDFLKYVTQNRGAQNNEPVALFNSFVDVIKGIIEEEYLYRKGVDEILRGYGTSLRSLGLKNCLDMYTLFIASRYFDSIEDHVNFVMSSRRLRSNMEMFFYNPVSLNKTTREFFPNLKTLYIYSDKDETFDSDDKIIAREVLYPYDWTKERAPNTTYHNLVLTMEHLQGWLNGRERIFIDDWPKINENVALDDSFFKGLAPVLRLELPSYVTRLGKFCLAWQHAREIVLPTSLKMVGDNCFKCCDVEEIELPKSCMVLSAGVFDMCELTRVVLPEGLGYLPANGFNNCYALVSISIPTSVMSIGKSCFHGCSSLSSIEIPPLVTRLEWGTFYKCSSLQDVKLPENLSVIKYCVFRDCCKLTRLTLPSSLLKVEDSAFLENDNLTVVNKSPLLLQASIFGIKAVENVGLVNLKGLDTEQLIRMQKAESAFNKLFRLDLLIKPHRINEFRQLVREVVSNDPTKNDGNATSEINSARGRLSDLAQLTSLALLANFPGLGEFCEFSEFSVLSELQGKGSADVN